MKISEEMIDAYLVAMPIGWSGHVDELRAGLTAVAPLIAAQALRDAAASLELFANKYDDRTATADELHVAHGIRTSATIVRRIVELDAKARAT
jgi:hypothetical protein